MALKKTLTTNRAGQTGEYIRFHSIELPTIAKAGIGNAILTMAVYRDELAAKAENRAEAALLRYSIAGDTFLGMSLADPDMTAAWVYQHIRDLVPEYADAEDIIDPIPEPELPLENSVNVDIVGVDLDAI